MKKNIVILTGAGISAESGIRTFRDSGGMWEDYDIMEVASIQGWNKNQQLVLDFYNARRKQLLECKPNRAHYLLAELEEKHNVQIITQNVDDLHERAGSKNILHLHGELKKVRSSEYPNLIHELNCWELKMGDKCEKGYQLRPHIVWFGEEVPEIPRAIEMVKKADVFIVIGTSLNVYPAAGLIDYASYHIPKYIIDPNDCNVSNIHNITSIKENASVGVAQLVNSLMNVTL
ncbi:MAG: NAD-dependent deacylase [Bacteroidota bacterium]